MNSSAADCTSAELPQRKTLCEAASSYPFKCVLQLHAQATEVAQLTRLCAPPSCRSSYNTKLHLPSSKADSFAHLDCDWKRGGITSPAPQCLVACSSSHVDSTEVFRARFINAEPDIEAHQHRPAMLSPAPKRQRAPYRLPRPQTGAAPRGTSTEPPESCRDFTDAAGRSSGPKTLEMGTLLMFDHRTYARGYTYCVAPTHVSPVRLYLLYRRCSSGRISSRRTRCSSARKHARRFHSDGRARASTRPSWRRGCTASRTRAERSASPPLPQASHPGAGHMCTRATWRRAPPCFGERCQLSLLCRRRHWRGCSPASTSLTPRHARRRGCCMSCQAGVDRQIDGFIDG